MDASNESIRRSEMVMIRTAFRNGWPVPTEKRLRIIAQLNHVINSPTRSKWDKQKAVETLAVVTGEFI